ncbi:unnamed protein product [Chrysoparadoxa australica]
MIHKHIVRYYHAMVEDEEGGEAHEVADEGEPGGADMEVQGSAASDSTEQSDGEFEDELDGVGFFQSSARSISKRKGGMGSYLLGTNGEESSRDGSDGGNWSSSADYEPAGGSNKVLTSQDFLSVSPGMSLLPASLSSEEMLLAEYARSFSKEEVEPIKAKRVGAMLYIQMEYCEKTLRSVIDEGNLWKSPSEVWRLFRQMLEGVQFIHRMNFLHRDLKPPNIFLDREGNVKVGDFGLASEVGDIASELGRERDDEGSSGLGGKTGGSSTGGGVGTLYYAAPEQAHAVMSSKADMWSLGVIFFEMLQPPFPTLMERAEVLLNLRQTGQLPDDLESKGHLSPAARSVLKWLLQLNATERPSATELLASPLLPPKIEVEAAFLEEALASIQNPDSAAFGEIVTALFNRPLAGHEDLTFDVTSAKPNAKQDTRRLSWVCSRLVQLFEAHGACSLEPPTVRPKATLEQAQPSKAACQLLDHKGRVVVLPENLAAGVAWLIARRCTGTNSIKRYQIGNVFLKTHAPKAGQPLDHAHGEVLETIEADFDVIGTAINVGGGEVLDSEVIFLTAQVMGLWKEAITSWTLRLGHLKLTSSLLELAGLKPERQRLLSKILSAAALASSKEPGVTPSLSKMGLVLEGEGLSVAEMRAITPLLTPLGESPLEALDNLEVSSHAVPRDLMPRGLMPRDHLRKRPDQPQRSVIRAMPAVKWVNSDGGAGQGPGYQAEERSVKELPRLRRVLKMGLGCLASLRKLVGMLEELGLAGQKKEWDSDLGEVWGPLPPRQIILDLGLSKRTSAYTGTIFHADLSSPQPLRHHPNTIAEGGRYDRITVGKGSVVCSGVRFAVEKLAALSASCETLSEPLDAVVCTGGGLGVSSIKERLMVCCRLWADGLRAEYLPNERLFGADLVHDQVSTLCQRLRIPFVVTVKTHVLPKVKVHAVADGQDDLVQLSELGQHLKDHLLNRQRHTLRLAHDTPPAAPGPGKARQSGIRLHTCDWGAGYAPNADTASKLSKKDFKRFGMLSMRVATLLEDGGQDDTGPTVLSVDAPYSDVRRFSTLYMAGSKSRDLTEFMAGSWHKKSFRMLAEALSRIEAEEGSAKKGKARQVYVYSTVDDALDLVTFGVRVT